MTFLGSQGYAQAEADLSIAGSSSGVGAAAGALVGRGALIGSAHGVASATGTMSGPSGSMSGTSLGVATVSGALHNSTGTAGAATGFATVMGLLHGIGALRGSAAGIATCLLSTDPCVGFVAQPGWLDDDQLADLQEVVLESLPFHCEVLKNAGTAQDEDGNPIDAWQTLICYNCDVEPLQALTETPGGSKLIATGLFLVTLPYNAAILPEYRLSINGTVYEVENDAENLTDQACAQVTVRQSR